MVGFLVDFLLQVYWWEKFENRLTFGKVIDKSRVSCYFGSLGTIYIVVTQLCQCPLYKDTKTYYRYTEKCNELTMRSAVPRTEIDMATSSLLTVIFLI